MRFQRSFSALLTLFCQNMHVRRLLFFLFGFVLMACRSDAQPQKEISEEAVVDQIKTGIQDRTAVKLDDEASQPTILPPGQTQDQQEGESDEDRTTKEDHSDTLKHPIGKAVSARRDSTPNDSTKEDEQEKTIPPVSSGDDDVILHPVVGHEVWDRLLGMYVDDEGKVDYRSFKNDHSTLKTYLETLSGQSPSKEWDRERTMAYWINAYNAHTVDLILSRFPVRSITDLDGGNPWDVKRIEIGGEDYSLNNIEHDILRAQFKDPRIHFAVNCAAVSCPKLSNKAWTASDLDKELTRLTVSFVNNSNYNKIQKNKASLSKIFEWYKDDFGDLIKFINRYSSIKLDSGASLEYLDYNWNLNSR